MRQVIGSSLMIGGLAALATILPLQDRTLAAPAPTLFEIDFDSSAVGSTVPVRGFPLVDEPLLDDSSSTSGVSEVEVAGGNKRYRLDDSGIDAGEFLGIRASLSPAVGSGSLHVEAVVTTAQQADGATLAASKPNDLEWVGLVKFGSDGKFHLHGDSTAIAYVAGHDYLVEMDISWGLSNTTVDYTVTDLTVSGSAQESNGHVTTGLPLVGDVRYRTSTTATGEFTIDDLVATR